MPLTYLIDSEYHDTKTIENKLNSEGWINIKNKNWSDYNNRATFMYLDGRNVFRKRYRFFTSLMKNTLKFTDLFTTNKWETYKMIMTQYPKNKFMPKTWLLDDFKQPVTKPYMVKPLGGFKGFSIYTVTNNEQLMTVKRKTSEGEIKKKMYKHLGLPKLLARNQFKFIITEYIHPLLLNGKKFNLRCNVLITDVDGQKTAYDTGIHKIIMGLERYDKKRITDSSVSNIHYSGTAYDFPDGLKGRVTGISSDSAGMDRKSEQKLISKIQKGVTSVLKKVCSVFLKKTNRYPAHRGGFCIMGCDLLIAENGNVYFIEINGCSTGLTTRHHKNTNVADHLFTNVYNLVISPIVYDKKIKPSNMTVIARM